MLESPHHLRKRKYSTNIKKSKEEQEKDLIGIPRNIGPYELIEKIKDGGYSKIYKAKSNYTGDFVAIKTIEKSCFQESAEDVLLMVRQTEVLKILKHRNLVNLYEIYESLKFVYLIMDYLPNGDLIEQIIKKKRYQEQEALAIFSQLVDALYYMHKNEICHRDIRTEKILFDKKNKPKLVGFSYSTFYTKGKKIRDSYGSLCYACPEIIQNDYYNPELADVWSLGVVLYVMICGYLPFSEDDDNENRYLIINGKVDYPPEISNKVKDLLRHMLDIDPNKRYTFQKIIKHPWFKPFSEETLTGGCNPYKMIYPVDERILKLIVIYGFNKKEVDKYLKQNIFNARTGLYKQLSDKLLYMGFTSSSDLYSDDFIKFRNDKENIISDGEIKYKKYINKILEKIKKVERYVDDYKRKEDKIIKDLENLYNDAVIEERKNKQKMKEKNMKNNNDKTNKINDISKLKRKTVTPFQIIKETKTLKNIIHQNKNKKNENDEDFDALKAFNDENRLKSNHKNSSILSIEPSDFDINDSKIKRSKSNPNILDFVQKLLEKHDRDRDISDFDSELHEDSIDIIRNSRKKRQLSVIVKRRKRSYLNTGNESDYFLKRPKGSDERKKKIEDNYKKSIKQVIIEENVNEEKDKEEQQYECNNYYDFNTQKEKNENIKKDIDNFEKKESKISENKRKKSLRFSLSFGEDDDEEEEDHDINSSFSKIESKRASMYDIDEEIKELREIKNNIKSPLRSSFLKRNSNDNNLVNFNMENNNSIFGEHLDDCVNRKNSNVLMLESINEKYDLLTELKRLSDNAYSKNKNKKNEEDKEKNKENEEINEFINDSFGESKNGKEKETDFTNTDNNKDCKNNKNLIVFDDKLEISFHDDKSDNNNEAQNEMNNIDSNLEYYIQKKEKNLNEINKYIFYCNDEKKLSKLNIFNKLEDMLFSANNIKLKQEKEFIHEYINDKFPIKKLKIINEDTNLFLCVSKMNKLNKNENFYYTKGKAKLNNSSKNGKTIYNNIIDKEKFKIKSENNQKKNRKNPINKGKNEQYKSFGNKSNLTNDLNEQNYYNINRLLKGKNNNIINFYNRNENFNQKIYIFNKTKYDQNEIKTFEERKINNNVIINTENNITSNLSIKNLNNYQNYKKNSFFNTDEKKEKKNKINYAQYIKNFNLSKLKTYSKNSKNLEIKNSPIIKTFQPLKTLKRNNNFELFLANSERLKSNKKRKNYSIELSANNMTPNIKTDNKSVTYAKNKNNESISKIIEKNIIAKNLYNKFKNIFITKETKKKKIHDSFERSLHISIMNDENEELESTEKIISKVKKGQILNKLFTNKKSDNKKNNKYLVKFVKKPKISKDIDKQDSSYKGLYLKKLKFNKNIK